MRSLCKPRVRQKILLVICFFCLSFKAHSLSPISVKTDSINNTPSVIVGPSSDTIFKMIRDSTSLISPKGRLRAAHLIRKLDKMHRGRLKGSSILIREPKELSVWIAERTFGLPDLTPICERTIMSALSLQIEILDKLLLIKDRNKAEQLQAMRTKYRVRDKSQRIFGDSRDVFICSALEMLKQINGLENALWSTGESSFDFPCQLNDLPEVEEYLLSKIELVMDKARQAAHEKPL
jgi:hypothetical protein